MWDSIAEIFNGFPVGYRMVMLPLLIIVGLWVLAHIRRDRQGKIYFHSNVYEQKKHTAKLDKVLETVEHMSMDMLRLQLFNEGLPVEERLLAGARYTEGGGNGPSGRKFEDLKIQYAATWDIVQNLRKESSK